MIILEGPDNSGKTTLAQKICREFNLPIHHSGGPSKNRDDIFRRHGEVMLHLEERRAIVMDRAAIISDPIYRRIIRKGESFFAQPDLERFRALLRVPVIYCRPSTHHLMQVTKGHSMKAQHETAEHVAGVVEHQEEIVKAYDDFFSTFPHVRYDFEDEPGQIFYDFIGAIIQVQR